MKIEASKDSLAGVLFLAIGCGAVYLAGGYGMGSPRSPGPGFFPMLVGGALAIFGVALSVNSLLRAANAAKVQSWQILPAIFILGGVVVFAIVMRSGHFFLAIVALVFISSLSRGRLTARELGEVALMAVALCAMSAGIFVYGLGMPLQLW